MKPPVICTVDEGVSEEDFDTLGVCFTEEDRKMLCEVHEFLMQAKKMINEFEPPPMIAGILGLPAKR